MTESKMSGDPPHNRRRSKWVPGQGQLKIATLTFFATLLVLLFNLYYCNLGLWLIYENPATTLEGVLEQTQSMMTKQILLSSTAAVLLSILVALSFYKVLGPIYRFKQYLHDLQTGRWDRSCHLRKGDELQDVRDELNTTVRLMAERARSEWKLLIETRDVLCQLADVAPDKERIRALVARMEAEEAEYARRFGADAAAASPAALADDADAAPPSSGASEDGDSESEVMAAGASTR